MANAPPDEAVARFRDNLTALTAADAPAGWGRLLVAVSGGPDSMALLALAAAACPGRTEAATVDHGLRAEAADEAAMVAEYCRAMDIPHAILRPATPIAGSIQANARRARYALLEEHRAARDCNWILTAHHADDQAETLLMRLNRASGVSGLAGVRARNGRIVRPLLGWRRVELAEIVHACALPHADDPSNRDSRFDRVVLRQAMSGAEWLNIPGIARSAQALADAETALEWQAEQLARAHVERRDAPERLVLTCTRLPRELLRRLLLRMMAMLEPESTAPRGATLDQALVQLSDGRKAMIGDLLLTGGREWTVRRAPPRRNA